jgi:hypothetical protein
VELGVLRLQVDVAQGDDTLIQEEGQPSRQVQMASHQIIDHNQQDDNISTLITTTGITLACQHAGLLE